MHDGHHLLVHSERLFVRLVRNGFVSIVPSNAVRSTPSRLGYFLFDSIDMMRNFSGRQTYEIILHHATVGPNARASEQRSSRVPLDYYLLWHFSLSWRLHWLLCAKFVH